MFSMLISAFSVLYLAALVYGSFFPMYGAQTMYVGDKYPSATSVYYSISRLESNSRGIACNKIVISPIWWKGYMISSLLLLHVHPLTAMMWLPNCSNNNIWLLAAIWHRVIYNPAVCIDLYCAGSVAVASSIPTAVVIKPPLHMFTGADRLLRRKNQHRSAQRSGFSLQGHSKAKFHSHRHKKQ